MPKIYLVCQPRVWQVRCFSLYKQALSNDQKLFWLCDDDDDDDDDDGDDDDDDDDDAASFQRGHVNVFISVSNFCMKVHMSMFEQT